MRKQLSRLSSVLLSVVVLATGLPATTAQGAAAAALDPFTGYLMAHFIGEGSTGQQMYFAHSKDGLRWSDLNAGRPVLLSTIGTRGVRDPALVRSPAGDRYWIIATDLCIGCGQDWGTAINNGSRSLVVWESTDLVNWSAPWLLNVAGAISDGRNAWAPEAIWNPATNEYNLYWATNVPLNGVTKHRIFYARTTNFRTVTAAQPYITRSGSTEIIDTQIIEIPGSVGGYRYVRASGDGQITVEGSNSILGTWTYLGNMSHLGLPGSQVEGPMYMKFNDRAEWGLYLDQYAAGAGYMPLLTTNPASPTAYRRPAAGSYNLGANRKRHGSILNLTGAEESRVLAKWTPTSYRITNRNSGKVIDVQNPNTSDGAAVGQWAWSGNNWQQWRFEDAGSGYFRIVSRHSGKCLDVPAGSTADGSAINQWTCNGGTNQQFQWAATGSYFNLRARHSGKCVTVVGASTTDGALLEQRTCGTANRFQWSRTAA